MKKNLTTTSVFLFSIFFFLLLMTSCSGTTSSSGGAGASGSAGTSGGTSGSGTAGISGVSGGLGGSAGSSPEVEQARVDCVNKINEYRATLSLTPLTRWTEAETCTDGQASEDQTSNTAHGSFGDCGELAQNECVNYPSYSLIIDSCLPSMWAEGPGSDFSTHGHYLNMANTHYTQVACGFSVGTPLDLVFSTQIFR